jgi:hypothetical protein
VFTKSAAWSGSVFLVALHGFERAQAAKLAFDGHADRVRHVDDLARDILVVRVVGDRLAVLLERAVHHHRREAEPHRADAYGRRLAVVLVHHDRNVRIALDGRFDQVTQECLACVFARARRRLHDHRAVGLRRRGHDRLHLLEVVDVERGQAVAVLGRVIEQLAHRNEGHRANPSGKWERRDFTERGHATAALAARSRSRRVR